MRLNDIKTQEIRAAQEDPNSMFDMSNAGSGESRLLDSF